MTALWSALIHVLPVAFALYEIIINLDGRYLGATFENQSYYQIVAKAHEIMIGASLSSIVFSFLRDELTDGDGLPFGAFVSGLQFLTISYLWSKEFWSSLLTSTFKPKRRTFFFLLITVCTIIAAAAGPSSASLLIPRLTLWPVASTYFAIDGSSRSLQPDQLSADQITTPCLMISQECGSPSDSQCPAADWQQLADIVHTVPDFTANQSSDGKVDSHVKSLFKLPSQSGATRDVSLYTYTYEGKVAQVAANIIPEIIVAAGLDDYSRWLYQYQYEDSPVYTDSCHVIFANFSAPYTAVNCLSGTITGPRDTTPLRFPPILRTNGEQLPGVPIDTLSKSDLYATASNASEFRISWTDLPAGAINGPASGAILLYPRGGTTGLPQRINTCTLAAGWGRSVLLSHTNEFAEFYAGPFGLPPSYGAILPDNDGTSVGTAMRVEVPIVANVSGYSYPQVPIQLSTSWLVALNPTVTLANGTETPAINYYMSSSPEGLSEWQIAKVFSLMLVTGLSKIGSDLPFRGIPSTST